jgi:hypothetical protein
MLPNSNTQPRIMPEPQQHERLPNYTLPKPQPVEGGYRIQPQYTQSGCNQVFMIVWCTIWLGGSGLGFIASLRNGDLVPILFTGLFVVIGLGVAYGFFILPWWLKLVLRPSYFATSDWPQQLGHNHGFSFQRLLRSGTTPPGSKVLVLVSCAAVTATQQGTDTIYNSEVLWQQHLVFPQESGQPGFSAQWNSEFPSHLPASLTSNNHWIEWQVAIKIEAAGIPGNLEQYMLWVE